MALIRSLVAWLSSRKSLMSLAFRLACVASRSRRAGSPPSRRWRSACGGGGGGPLGLDDRHARAARTIRSRASTFPNIRATSTGTPSPQRRQIRLDQGDRRRRPRRRAFPAQLGGRQGGGHRERAPITSSIGAARRSRRSAGSSRTRRSRRTCCRRCSTSRRPRNPRPASATSTRQPTQADMKVMLEEMQRYLRPQARHLHHRRFL